MTDASLLQHYLQAGETNISNLLLHHYKELEEIGLAAPQTTYLMQELKKRGADVNTDATTVEEAADAIEAWLKASK